MKKLLLTFLFLPIAVFSQSRPDHLTNLSGWVRADSTGLTYTNGAAVDSVLNLGDVGGWFIQATGDNQPIYRTGVANGQPGIDFDGTDDNLAMPSSTALWNFLHNSTDQTVFTVFLLDNVNESQIIIHNNNFASAAIGFGQSVDANNFFTEFITRNVSGQPVITALSSYARYATGTVYFVTTTFDEDSAPDHNMWVNGRLMGEYNLRQAASASNATANLTLGHSSAALNGKLLEWIAYDDLKSASDIAVVETYIKNKYYSSFVAFSGTQPDQFSNLRLWLRADSMGLTYAGDAAVDSMRNWGTNAGWFVQATGGNQPIYRSSVSTNGKPGVDFDGNDDDLAHASSTQIYNFFHRANNIGALAQGIGDEMTFFAVIKLDATGQSIICQNNGNNNDNQGVQFEITAGNTVRMWITNGTVGQETFDVATTGTYESTTDVQYFWATREEDGVDTAFVKVNNVEAVNAILADGYSNTDALANFSLGRAAGSALDGKILEIFAYDDRKTAAELATLTTYIQSKYGLTVTRRYNRTIIIK